MNAFGHFAKGKGAIVPYDLYFATHEYNNRCKIHEISYDFKKPYK